MERTLSDGLVQGLLLAGMGVIVFASTNADDIFVLLAFFSDPRFRVKQVVAGQYLGIAALTAASIVFSLASLVIPGPYVGLLGFVPLGMGIWKLLVRQSTSREEQSFAPRANVLAVTAVTLANGGDNLALYTPMFATRRPGEVGLLAVVFLLMTGVWCKVAHSLIRHPKIGPPIRRCGRMLLPWVLIALGLYILVESSAYRVLSSSAVLPQPARHQDRRSSVIARSLVWPLTWS